MFEKNSISTYLKHIKTNVLPNKSKINTLVFYMVKNLEDGKKARP